ncbi:MAG: cobalamin B12-binding domain-containing protein [Chloroflexi bacterium]|nr:cobalamin B12-binding domain-containing protein [Chloroflexota bacterium]
MDLASIRVLLTKIGLDGHDTGVLVVARALRDAGVEVIYTGPWQTPESVVEAAIQEDADVIGISSLAYDHVLVPKLMARLRERGIGDVPVLVGGVIPGPDIKKLKEAGVVEVFHPGAKLDDIVAFIDKLGSHRPETVRA